MHVSERMIYVYMCITKSEMDNSIVNKQVGIPVS